MPSRTIGAMQPAPPTLSSTPSRYTVTVRSLCEFAAKQGDLDLRFTPSPSARQGIAGHQAVAAQRGLRYQAELPLAGQYQHLQVRGRADGYDPDAQRLDEVKTFRGDLARQPANHRLLHWAQAKVYGHLLCQQLALPAITVALVYFDVGRQQAAAPLTQHCTAADLQAFFESLCQRFLHWADAELLHRARRDRALEGLAFPHAGFRAGQRPLAEAVYRRAKSGGCLLAQAPTGIGKTLGTLFPLLKACPSQGIDKLVFLTAKGSGRGLAMDALDSLRGLSATPPGAHRDVLPGAPVDVPLDTPPGALALRVINLVSRDKACEHPDKLCQGDSCPLARGFYDRLPAARAAAVAQADQQALTQQALRQTALAHQVCPYYLGHELARWCDVLVGDYNHWFDSSALLHGLAQAQGWRVALLIDEAHNLPDRARQMYSAELDSTAWHALRAVAPAVLKKPLARVQRCWARCVQSNALAGAAGVAVGPTGPAGPAGQPGMADDSYSAHADVPPALARALQEMVAAIGDYLADQPLRPTGEADTAAAGAAESAGAAGAADSANIANIADTAEPTATTPASLARRLMPVYFEALAFCRLLDSFGPHSMFDITRAPAGGQRARKSTLCLRNVLPAPFLAPRFAAAHCNVLFSATLSPQAFYADTLGLPADTGWLDVAAPFHPRQLRVHIVRQVSTRYADRAASLVPIADLVARQYRQQPGHYLAFFSSFDYLQQAAATLALRHPHIPAWQQERQMDEAQRSAFLARFTPGGRGIGFAVLGGVFAEGIDLVGNRLIGAFIATLGLPQINPRNEEMRRRQQAAFGAGYEYTYLVPGLRKVVQAAGRVIRTPTDVGSVHLIDDRFARPEVRRLLPAWWRIEPALPPPDRDPEPPA